MNNSISPQVLQSVQQGVVVPACPLALNAQRKLDERRQRALIRYYLASDAGGLAVGVHTTQFAIRDPKHGVFEPILRLALEEMKNRGSETFFRVAGVCGKTSQAVGEACLVRELGYHAALLSLGAMRDADEDELIAHCREVAQVIPVIGFYLQPAVGGRVLPFSFWRKFAEIENVVAIKMAPFNRYQTIDVVRAIAEASREDIALYTGNDDNIVADLVTPFRFQVNGKTVERRIVGGLLGQWAVGTNAASQLLRRIHQTVRNDDPIPSDLLRLNTEVTDINAALFDVAHGFSGCIAGIHEVLRRQGLLEGIWCLDEHEQLSPGQMEEIDRVHRAYPHLHDDAFIQQHLDEWLKS